VTICIAAIAAGNPGQEPHIVTVSDTKVSGAIISADSLTVKVEPFHKEWFAMMAGDLGQCVPIIEKAAGYFAGRANKLSTARKVFKRGFSQHLVEMQEDAALSRYDMTMKEFIRTGKKRLSERMLESIRKQIEETKTGCEFIVAGFDSLKRPHLFHITEEGKDIVCDKPGYCAIGSGKWVAETILYSLKQSIDRTFAETIFNVCAAKFMAEQADGVGKASYLVAKKAGSTSFHYVFGMTEAIRDAWERVGCPRIPEGIISTISNTYHPRCE
jgi:20S proteasome alpha/beta subunit